MTESSPAPKPQQPSRYALALEVAGTATAWIVVPALIAAFGGQALDSQFQTKSWIFVSAMGLAFIITVFGIIRMAKEYLKEEGKGKGSGSGKDSFKM
jgi:F0F1-type ATP synthase assembly protein I